LGSTNENYESRKTRRKKNFWEGKLNGLDGFRTGSARAVVWTDFAFCNDVAGAGEADSLFEQNCGIFHFPLMQMTPDFVITCGSELIESINVFEHRE
jgi:hypothetical protein